MKTKVLADWYAGLEPRLGLAVEMAQATAFAGAPEALLELPGQVEAVTDEDLRRATAWLSTRGHARRS